MVRKVAKIFKKIGEGEPPMKNGLYKVLFQTPMGQRTGVIVIMDGTLRGGDASMYYVGAFSDANNQFTASIRVGKHSDIPSERSVFVKEYLNLKLTGTSAANSATACGIANELPGVQFHVNLTLIP